MIEKPKASQPLNFELPNSQPAQDLPKIQLNLDSKENRLDTTSKSSTNPSKPTAAGKKGTAGKTRGASKQNLAVIIVSVISATVLLLLGLLMFGAASEASVVVRWKMSERELAAMRVDGRSRKVPSAETFTLKLPPGRHDIDFKRDGYMDITHSMNLQAGERTTIDVNKWRPGAASGRRR